MANSEIIVGLDIGTTKIAVIVGTRNQYGKIEILGSGKADSIGVKRGVVNNIEKTVESIGMAIRHAEQESNVDIKRLYVGIAGQHIKSLQHRGSIIRNSVDDIITHKDVDTLVENMYKLVMQPGEEIIHVIPQDFIVDKESGIRDPKGMTGSCLEANFHIITGMVSAAKNINRCILMSGMEVEDLILEPLASAEAVLGMDEKEAGVALVDIGGGTTDIAIFQDGIIRHTAVIPLGGNIITEDIQEGCSIIRAQAEAIKVKFGSALSEENKSEEIVSIPGLRGTPPREISLKNLANIIQARMEEIIGQVYWEIKNSGYERKLIAGIVLTGGGAQLKHIRQLTEYLTGMNTRIGYPNEHMAGNMPDELCSPMYSTGIGLVIKGFEHTEKKNKVVKKGKEATSKGRLNFFDSIVKSGKTFFEADNIK
ncbi:MAG TPA: cell division protein FtsA [Bacteroidales bacterium]|nr:cell division protein FtsA [Bacteroidales bacterium]HRZ48282.1 cell division protein FtsA [Bacteroidales bacterium]